MSSDKVSTPADKAIAKIANLIIERMEQLKGETWQKNWLNISQYTGLPQNISGRQYQGSNIALLSLATAIKGYEMPVFTTFNEAIKEGLRINKGAKSVPVIYYTTQYKDTEGNRVSEKDYRTMSEEERQNVTSYGILKKFDVFNIADTNFQEIKPELYETFKQKYAPTQVKDTQGMYSNTALDRMFEFNEWLCPIDVRPSEKAYYNPSNDFIVVPTKLQYYQSTDAEGVYRDGMSFYATALHEMAHSTGRADRLNRKLSTDFSSKQYAKEELIAELTAAIVGQQLGFDKKISDDNAKYLNSWIQALQEEPRFILSVLGEVGKASTMIMEQVDVQKQKIENMHTQRQTPPRNTNIDIELNSNVDLTQFSNSRIRIEAKGNDNYHITSDLRLYRCEIYDFVLRYLKGYLPKKDLYLTGLCSKPQGIFHHPKSESQRLSTTPQEIETKQGIRDKSPVPDKYLTDTAMVKNKDGSFAVRGKINHEDTGLLPITKQEAITYFSYKTDKEKETYLSALISSHAENKLSVSSYLSQAHASLKR